MSTGVLRQMCLGVEVKVLTGYIMNSQAYHMHCMMQAC
jgi:hypothetical protein